MNKLLAEMEEMIKGKKTMMKERTTTQCVKRKHLEMTKGLEGKKMMKETTDRITGGRNDRRKNDRITDGIEAS